MVEELPPGKRWKFIGFGFPRSGTMYIQTVLVRLGFDIRHEDMGKDGGVGWYFAQNDLPLAKATKGYSKWCPPLNRIEHVAYIKRDPIKILSSCIANLGPKTWGSYAVGKHPHTWSKAISSYMEYVKLAKERIRQAKNAGCQTHIIHLEQSSWCEDVVSVPRDTNTRLRHKPPTVKELITMFKDEKEIHSFLLDECKNDYIQGFLYPGGH